MTITFYNNGAWGAGKGSALSAAEVDNNFWDLLNRTIALNTNAAAPVNIASIQQVGTSFKVVMTDSTEYGPFDLPIAAFNWRGEWLPLTDYDPLDLVYVEEKGLFLVIAAHTTGTAFDIYQTDSDGHVYTYLFGRTRMYDISYYFPGLVGDGLGTYSPLMQMVMAREVFIPSTEVSTNASAGEIYLRVPNTSGIVLDLQKNGVKFGEIHIGAGENVGAFSIPLNTFFIAGDVFSITQPDIMTETQTGTSTLTRTQTEALTITGTLTDTGS
jgi:hypothetical protein